MTNEITEPSDLFDKKGNLIQDGWARKPLLRYNKENIAAKWHRIKEWDNYVINHPNYNFSVTIADVGYMGLISIELFDYIEQKVYTGGFSKFFTKGKWNLPTSSTQGNIEFDTEEFSLKIVKTNDTRKIVIEYPNFEEKGLNANLTLSQNPNHDTIVKVNRYKNVKQFYYSDKIIGMPIKGSVIFGEKEYPFDSEECYARLDWGRGVWPFRIHWYWGAGAGKSLSGRKIWFSLGHSYEDPSFHDKNMIGVDGKGHKLTPIKFHLPNDSMDTWRFTSEDKSVEMSFKPMFFHRSKMNLVIFASQANIVFGYYDGTIKLEDKTMIELKNVLGHAEKVNWRW